MIKLLWESDGPVDFEGQFYKLHHARLDTEPFEGRFPKIWLAASGPRMLEIAGRYADGWWPAGAYSPEDYAGKLQKLRQSAERAGRDPMAITPAFIWTCLIGDEAELEEILKAPLVQAYLLHISADILKSFGFEHPMGQEWRGFQDINPATLTRERILAMLAKSGYRAIRAIVPCGTPQQIATHSERLCGCRPARAEDSRLWRHGGLEVRRPLGAESEAKLKTSSCDW